MRVITDIKIGKNKAGLPTVEYLSCEIKYNQLTGQIEPVPFSEVEKTIQLGGIVFDQVCKYHALTNNHLGCPVPNAA